MARGSAAPAALLCGVLAMVVSSHVAQAELLEALTIPKKLASSALAENYLVYGGATGADGTGVQFADGAAGNIASVWTRQAHNMQELSMFLEFTVVGRGEHDPSQGTCSSSTAGIWVNTEGPRAEGSQKLAGRETNFKGFGLVINACQPADGAAEGAVTPNDMQLVINPDGARVEADILAWASGCRLPQLQWQDNADGVPQATFSVKLMVYQGMAFVLHDVTNKNLYMECTTQALELDEQVLNAVKLGFSVSSGPGGTNSPHGVQGVTLNSAIAQSRWDHDPGYVVEAHPGESAQQAQEAAAAMQDAASGTDGVLNEAGMEDQLNKMKLHEWASEQRLAKLEETLHTQMSHRLDKLEASLQDSMSDKLSKRLATLEDQIKVSAESSLTERIGALERQFREDVEEKLAARVRSLEDRVKDRINNAHGDVTDSVDVKLSDRLRQLEETMKTGLEAKIGEMVDQHDGNTRKWVDQLEQKLDARAESGVENLKQHVSKVSEGGGGWQTPFIVLIVVVCGVAIFMYVQYKKEQKRHLL